MAITARRTSRWRTGLHFLVRFVGLTGLMAGAAGLVLWKADHVELGKILTEAGFGVAAFALLVEILRAARQVAGRRGAFGFNVILQIALALALLAGVNAYSFFHYIRKDLTRDHIFTIPETIRVNLGRLRTDTPTKIVLHQTHVAFGKGETKKDTGDAAYEAAAERQVVEKVKDLVEQFEDLGPKFQVVVLDVQEEGYANKLAEITENAPELREAIRRSPENSIFFSAHGKVQRLGFSDIYELDKEASRKANHDKGNLCLIDQGKNGFANRILALDEKPPRIGIGVIHEFLTTEGPEEFGLAGLRKSLESHGIECRDILMKKWTDFGPPEAGAYTYDESKLDRLESEIAESEADLKALTDQEQKLTKVRDLWKTASLDDLTKKYADQLRGERVTEDMRTDQLQTVNFNLLLVKRGLEQYEESRNAAVKDKAGLNVENLAEQRRMADVKAKMERLLADCDLLLIPRMTIRNVTTGERIPSRLYKMDDVQVTAVKDFLKAGKPVLACFGPANEPPEDRMRLDALGPGGPDGLEKLLAQLGIKFGDQTVLYNVESKSFAERRTGFMVSGVNVEVPSVDFDWAPGAGKLLAKKDPREETVNPIRESMRVQAKSQGENLDLRLRFPRPVYYEPPKDVHPVFDPIFMMTNPASWNDDQPFPSREHIPRFAPKSDDPARGTTDEKRLGPFPIGVAIETTLPSDWFAGKDVKPGAVRVAAIGHGGVFSGKAIAPAREKLLLDTCNWLLGREDLLAKAGQQWEYPRVALDDRQQSLWRWGAWLGLPSLAAYLGLIVLLFRRLR